MAPHKGKRTADDGGDLEGGGGKKSQSVDVPAVPAVERRITRNRRIEITNGPRQAVFMTTELLEHILMHLPLKELSVAQGACRRFREVVTTSAKLQQKLSLRPSALGLTEKWTMFVVENPEKEDGLELIRLHGNGTIPTTAILNPRNQSCLYGLATFMNPYLKTWREPGEGYDFFGPEGYVFERAWYHDDHGSKFVLLDSAFWKNMYLTDQPCKIAGGYMYWSIETTPPMSGSIKGHANTEAPLGFTIGSLLDAILGTELDRLWYFDGHKDVTLRKTTAGKLLTRLEKKTGLKVMVTFWQLDMHDLILTVGEEQQ
ncbi:hypothetical protein LTR12_008581 [Friedmanniomyces endolithicus]|nr:hypothetical protein LTR74_003156 [Friedmanniomyces endolithicus]KAK1816981.1 hypothetical protein LTR12_008581 [Friedmanniomyces endolithicus]